MASISWLLRDWRFIVSLVAVVIALFYHYTTVNFDYWKKRGIPVVKLKPIPFFGHMWKMMLGMENFNTGFSDLYKSLGDEPFAGFMQSMNPALLMKDSELIKHILIKDSHIFLDRAFHSSEEADPLNGKGLPNLRGRKWKEMRARLSPTFTSGRMKAMFPLMLNSGDLMVDSLKNRIQKGEDVVEIKDLTSAYTMSVIASCAFGIDCDPERNPEFSEFRRMGKLLFKPTLKRSIVLMFFFIGPKIMEWLKIGFTMEETAVFFRNFVKNLMESREKAIDDEEKTGVSTKHFRDFIHHLVLVKKRGLNSIKYDEEEDEKQLEFEGEQPSWATIDLDDITAQVMIFFSAGFETSSSLLSFVLYELSATENGQRLQRDLRGEIRSVMKEYDGKLTYDGVKKMHLLNRIICETLRLYPPAGLLSRRNTKEYTLPGTNYVLEPYTQIFISTYEMHRDPQYFPDPTRFDPDRFLPENKNAIQYKYIPFGDGPRHCIGQRFAELQARVGLIFLINNFEFNICKEKTSVPLKFNKRAFILTAAGGVWLRVNPIGH